MYVQHNLKNQRLQLKVDPTEDVAIAFVNMEDTQNYICNLLINMYNEIWISPCHQHDAHSITGLCPSNEERIYTVAVTNHRIKIWCDDHIRGGL